MMPVQLQYHSDTDEGINSYYQLSEREVIECFSSDADEGLSPEEVASRYEKYGWNELQFKPGKPAWLRFLLQFHQPLLYILLLAGAIKAILGSWTNAAVIWGSNETVQNWTTLAKRAFLLSINLVLLSISSSFCLPRTKN
jgi:magnesium-transporting ATPase (P-type)